VSESLVSLTGGHFVFSEAVSRIADSLSPLGAAGRIIAESYALVTEMRRINLEKTQAADTKEDTLALLERHRQESSATLHHVQEELGRADLVAQVLRQCMVNMQLEAVKPGLPPAERRAYLELTKQFTTMLVQHHSDLTGGVAAAIDKMLNDSGARVLAPASRGSGSRKPLPRHTSGPIGSGYGAAGDDDRREPASNVGLTTSVDHAFREPVHRLHRDVPVAIYLSNDGAQQEVQIAVEKLLDTLDLEVTYRGPTITGSWFRAMTARTRTKLATSEVLERLQKVERGLELHGLHKVQAEVDEKQGGTVAQLLTALENTPTAMIQIGSLLLVKVDGVPAVRNLTQLELRHLEKNPQLLNNPSAILDALRLGSSSSANSPS
jgi:hypothetical protein